MFLRAGTPAGPMSLPVSFPISLTLPPCHGEYLHPDAVFHAWGSTEEVIAYLQGVDLDHLFWDGMVEGPRD